MRKSYIRDSSTLIYEDGSTVNPNGKPSCTWVENNTGYILLRTYNPTKCLRLHRVLAECFIPNPKELPFVKHKNDDKSDNSLSNLEWGTNAENVQEGYDNGCYKFKSRQHGIKVTFHSDNSEVVFKSLRNLAENTEFNRKNVAAILKGKKNNTYCADFEYVEGLV